MISPALLRGLADELEERRHAPSLRGYDLAPGLRAAADLLEGAPGPGVHPGGDGPGSCPLRSLALALCRRMLEAERGP